jgi:Ca2+-binding EF-hand superfamily protein
LDDINTIDFFDNSESINYQFFIQWVKENVPLSDDRERILLPFSPFDWNEYVDGLCKA